MGVTKQRWTRAGALGTLVAALACGRGAARAQTARGNAGDRAHTTGSDAASAHPTPPQVAWDAVAPGVRVAHTTVTDPVDSAPLEWLVARLDLANASPVAEPTTGDALAGFAADPAVALAVDAGYFEPDHHPSGVLCSGGRTLGAWSPRAGTGLLVVDAARTADVLDATAAPSLDPTARLAVQCGPRLVERDGSIGIHRDDGRRYARTGACVRDHGRTLDLVLAWNGGDPMRGPGLLAFSQLLLARPSPVGDPAPCERALNLDGGPSTGAYVRGRPALSHAALGPVPYALVVRAPR